MIPRTQKSLMALAILAGAILFVLSIGCSHGSYFSCSAVYRANILFLLRLKNFFLEQRQNLTCVTTMEHITHFTVTRMSKAGCELGEIADLYITKDRPRAYWGPTYANANDHWTMKHDPNGQWRAIHQDTYLGPDGFFGYDGETSDMLPTSGNPYVVIPAAGDEESTQIGTVNFTADLGGHTSGCTWIPKFSVHRDSEILASQCINAVLHGRCCTK